MWIVGDEGELFNSDQLIAIFRVVNPKTKHYEIGLRLAGADIEHGSYSLVQGLTGQEQAERLINHIQIALVQGQPLLDLRPLIHAPDHRQQRQHDPDSGRYHREITT